MECEGTCKVHQGEVKKVNVIGLDGYDWGYFSYCATAIEEDRKSGFTVIESDSLT